MMIWKKQSKIWIPQQLIEDFNLFIKQCYHTAWSVENRKKRESLNPSGAKTNKGKMMFLSKCQDLSKLKKLGGC